MLTCFSHMMIYSKKHAESVQWYCTKLGFEIDYNSPGEYASLHHKLLGRLAIHATDEADKIANSSLPYFLCDDIQKTIAEFKSLGIKTTEPRREGESPWFASFADLDGNQWGMEEI